MDELDSWAAEQLRDPSFRAAYEAECRRIKRAWLGYCGRAYNGEYQRRLKARRRRRR